MKKYISLTLAGLVVLTGCTSDNGIPAAADGDGAVTLLASFPDGAGISPSDDSELLNNCTIFISNERGHIRTFNGVGELPEKLWLPSGRYVAEAWAGDSLPASFESKYYRGYQPFSIVKDENVSIPLRCPLANVVVSVVYDDGVKDALKSYNLKVYHARGSLVFSGDDSRKGYFMLPNGVSDLNWSLSGETYDGHQFIKKGVLKNVRRATEYRLKFNYSDTPSSLGGASVNLSVDLSEIDMYEEIELKDAPVIAVDGLDMSQTLVYERGQSRRHAVTITASAGLRSVTMTSPSFGALGLKESSYSLLSPTQATVEALYSKGINIVSQHGDDGSDAMVVNFSAKLCNLLPVGDYTFAFSAVDLQGRDTEAALKIKIVPHDTKR